MDHENGEVIKPDGSFEEVNECPFCGSESIIYVCKWPHITAICEQCEKFIKYVQQYHSLQKWSKFVKERDKYICKMCGKQCTPHNADAHHIKPKWKYPELQYNTNNGITLCKECHKTLKDKEEQHGFENQHGQDQPSAEGGDLRL